MSIKNIPINISSDPEFFIFDEKQKEIVSSIPIVKYDKENPIDLGEGFTTYCDNVSIEATLPVAYTNDEFVNIIDKAINKINKYLGERYRAVPVAAYNFPDRELKDPAAHKIGCSPFMLARPFPQIAEPPELPPGYRSAGMHLHIGRKDFKKCADSDFMIDPMSKIEIVKAMDIFVGVPSVIFDNSEESRSRKTIYTQSCSAHRPTAYGVEYRPLSSHCMRDKGLLSLIFDLTLMAINSAYNNQDFGIEDDMIIDCINNHDQKLAKEIMSKTLDENIINKIHQFAN